LCSIFPEYDLKVKWGNAVPKHSAPPWKYRRQKIRRPETASHIADKPLRLFENIFHPYHPRFIFSTAVAWFLFPVKILSGLTLPASMRMMPF
jgi:hypothetical protein